MMKLIAATDSTYVRAAAAAHPVGVAPTGYVWAGHTSVGSLERPRPAGVPVKNDQLFLAVDFVGLGSVSGSPG